MLYYRHRDMLAGWSDGRSVIAIILSSVPKFIGRLHLQFIMRRDGEATTTDNNIEGHTQFIGAASLVCLFLLVLLQVLILPVKSSLRIINNWKEIRMRWKPPFIPSRNLLDWIAIWQSPIFGNYPQRGYPFHVELTIATRVHKSRANHRWTAKVNAKIQFTKHDFRPIISERQI